MRIFNITFDEEATKRFHEEQKNNYPPERLHRFRIYELTDSYDAYRKYCRVTCYCEAVYVYIKKQLKRIKYSLRYLFSK